MPQMSPMWWLTLMILFNLSMILINNNLFFFKKINMSKNKKFKSNKFSWKW